MNVGENQSSVSPTQSSEKPTSIVNRSLKNPETLLLLILALFGLALVWRKAAPGIGIDFYQFWVVGQALHGSTVTDIYSDDERSRLGAEFLEKARRTGNPRQITVAEFRQQLQTYSSPFLYTVFGLFSTGNYEMDLRNYRVLLLAGLVFGIATLCRLLNHSLNTTLGAVAIFSVCFDPFASDLRMGNVNSLQLALFAAYLWVVARLRWRQRDVLGGVLIGLAVAFKPNLVLVAAVLAVDWLLNSQFRRVGFHAAGAAVGGIIAILAATASFGTLRCWTHWLAALQSLPDEVIPVINGNYAPARILSEGLGLNLGVPLAVILGGLAITGLWMKRQGASHGNRVASAADSFPQVLVVSTGCLLVVLLPRLAWLHYYVLAIPAFLVLLCPARNLPFEAKPLLRQFLVVLAFLGLATDLFFDVGILLTTHVQGTMAVGAILILFALTVFLQSPRARSGGD